MPPKFQPKVKDTPRYIIRRNHWSLIIPGTLGSHPTVLAGHVGPNPNTHEGVLKALEAFKHIVATAPLIEDEDATTRV